MPSVALAEEGLDLRTRVQILVIHLLTSRAVTLNAMYYVYILQTVAPPAKRYVGFTSDLKARLRDHNTGKNSSTAALRPWRLRTYPAFADKKRALAFESYLKSGSGHAFLNKRF